MRAYKEQFSHLSDYFTYLHQNRQHKPPYVHIDTVLITGVMPLAVKEKSNVVGTALNFRGNGIPCQEIMGSEFVVSVISWIPLNLETAGRHYRLLVGQEFEDHAIGFSAKARYTEAPLRPDLWKNPRNISNASIMHNLLGINSVRSPRGEDNPDITFL